MTGMRPSGTGRKLSRCSVRRSGDRRASEQNRSTGMKQGIVCLVAMAAGAGSISSFAQGRGGAAACTTLACDLQSDWDRNKGLITGIANAMPEDKYSYKST